MKKYFVLFLAISTLFLTSCKEDEVKIPKDNTAKEKIIGSWSLLSIDEVDVTGCSLEDKVEFTKTEVTMTKGSKDNGNCETKSKSFKYTIDGISMTVINDDDTKISWFVTVLEDKMTMKNHKRNKIKSYKRIK